MQSSTISVSFNNSSVKIKYELSVIEGDLYLETYIHNNKKNTWQLSSTAKINKDYLDATNNIPPSAIDLYSID